MTAGSPCIYGVPRRTSHTATLSRQFPAHKAAPSRAVDDRPVGEELPAAAGPRCPQVDPARRHGRRVLQLWHPSGGIAAVIDPSQLINTSSKSVRFSSDVPLLPLCKETVSTIHVMDTVPTADCVTCADSIGWGLDPDGRSSLGDGPSTSLVPPPIFKHRSRILL